MAEITPSDFDVYVKVEGDFFVIYLLRYSTNLSKAASPSGVRL